MLPEQRRHIEELRDSLELLQHDSTTLYRYGQLANSSKLFKSLSRTDQIRLIAVALLARDQAVVDVAKHLMAQMDPALTTADEALSALSPGDLGEVRAIFLPGTMREKTSEEEARIRRELNRSVQHFRSLRLEAARWVLIGATEQEHTICIDASGGSLSPSPAGLKLVREVVYNPGDTERSRLFALMRRSAWIVHVHNHPQGFCLPSVDDSKFVIYWKSQRPELQVKMRFFIVAGYDLAEYDEQGLVRPTEFDPRRE
jgi:hypothetical protein